MTTTGAQVTMDSATLVVEAGISYRQLDHWTRRGWLAASPVDRGPGFPRTYDTDQVKLARMVGELGRVLGIRASVAFPIARDLIASSSYEIGDYFLSYREGFARER